MRVVETTTPSSPNREPVRSCIACRRRAGKELLLRCVLRGHLVEPDPQGTRHGRGAWLHEKCLGLAITRHSFPRAFRIEAPLNYEALESYVSGEMTDEANGQ